MSQHSNRNRHSLPKTAHGAAVPHFQPGQMPMMWPMGSQMFNPYMLPTSMNQMPGPSEVSSKKSKPWDSSSNSSEEDDFKPSKKRKGTLRTDSKKGAEDSNKDKTEKRGPGRPKKATLENEKIVAGYPVADKQMDLVAYLQKDECPNCRIYKGKVAFKPCGHFKYCFNCTNKLRTEAIKLKRPAKCPAEDCYTLVEGWVELFNVSA